MAERLQESDSDTARVLGPLRGSVGEQNREHAESMTESHERRHQCEGGSCSHWEEFGRAPSVCSGQSRSYRAPTRDRRQNKASGRAAVERYDVVVCSTGSIQEHQRPWYWETCERISLGDLREHL